ncbi:MAG: MFS transporter [Deltaproteobacteria bacterium]|jgi:MFS family permease|nr:MFS transporter [Deltaproteobacteria bacterium]
MGTSGPVPPEAIRQRRLIVCTAVSANLLGNVGLIGVNVAAPAISLDLGMSAVEVNWISLATLMAMAMFSAPTARLADIAGRRLVTFLGLWVAIVGSALGAVAWSSFSLLVSRAITGVGLVAFFTTVTTMAAAAYPPEQRGRVLGMTIGSVYVGLSLGPALAGFLVERLGWPALFWFTAVGLLPTVVFVHLIKKDPPACPGEKMDYWGSLLWAVAVALIFSGLASLGLDLSILAVAAGLFLLGLFINRSLGMASPLIDLALFRDSRRFAFSSVAAYISYLSSFSVSYLVSLYLQFSKGLSPSEAGLLLIAQPVFQAVITPFAGRLSDRFDPGRLASLGLLTIFAASLFLANVLSLDTGVPVIVADLALFGVGFALFSAPNSNAIMGAAPPKRLGQASVVITVTRLWGQISCLAVTTLVFAIIIGPEKIQPHLYPKFVTAARVCFWLFAPLALLGVAASQARGGKGV